MSRIFIIGLLLLGALGLIVLWQRFARGPRLRRGLRRARQLVTDGKWQDALALVNRLQSQGRSSRHWQGRLARAEGECRRAATVASLRDKQFEQALEHAERAAALLGQPKEDARAGVIEAMLAEARRLFASCQNGDVTPVHRLLARALALQSPCPEASFWQGLCFLRDSAPDRALEAFASARGPESAQREAPRASRFIDPPLYLGAVLLRQGQAKEALRYLTEANRIDGNCPFVTAQLGTAIVRAGGDSQLATRALQRALGPRGFALWAQNPERAWVEGFPENRSFVRKLAAQHRYTCPLWGSDPQLILRQGNIALGQALYRLGQFQESSIVFNQLMQEGAPSLPVLRGLGLALARLGQYDPAFKHLRIAYDMEDPKDRLTAGYLALCGAKGKPMRAEDKAKNVAWAIRLVDSFTAPGDADWAGLISAIFAEARSIALPLDVNNQIYLCEHLLSVNAADALAAEAYHHLAGTHPEALRPEYAWLFCRAAQAHGVGGAFSLGLFARTFADQEHARAFFTDRGWDFDALELTYLERAAALQPGKFPEGLGTDYPVRGEALLLERSRSLEAASQLDDALAAADILLKLSPANGRAQDRLAQLYYRKGDPARSIELLKSCSHLDPDNPLPLVRQAIIAYELHEPGRCLEIIRRALDTSHGPGRARIAYLGARLLLKQADTAPGVNGSPEKTADQVPGLRRQAIELLEECVRDDSHHTQALWLLAALRFLVGEEQALASQAPLMDREEVADPRFHFLAAVCRLAGQDYPGVIAACERTATTSVDGSTSLAVEGAYLAGRALYLLGDLEGAVRSLQVPAQAADCLAAPHAQALLGTVHFRRAEDDEAIRWWKALDAKKRTAWKFSEALAGTMFLTALETFAAGDYQGAADKLREAGRLGLRDRRLGLLLTLCLVKAGQHFLCKTESPDYDEAARALEQAVKVGCNDPKIAFLLGVCYKNLGRNLEARTTLSRIGQPDAAVSLQLGLLSFADRAFPQAEQEFARAWQMRPASYEPAYNLLLTRLCLGQPAVCAGMIPELMPLATSPDEQRFLSLLEALLRSVPAAPEMVHANGEHDREALLASLTAEEEQRLLSMLGGLSQFEAAYPLLRRLAALRPQSAAAQEAYLEAVLMHAKQMIDRAHWDEAKELLAPLSRSAASAGPAKASPRPAHLALLNMLGCCACLLQDFDLGVWYFNAALGKVGDDAWLHQNLALANEWHARLDHADTHWNRYFDLLDRRIPIPPLPGYLDALAFEGLSRLADIYSRRDKWSNALTYLQRAQRIRPNDAETLERLFHLYNHLKRPEDARRALRRLREVRPNDPQFDLYELDIRDVRSVEDIERLLGDLRRALNRYPNDMRVEERAAALTAGIIPSMVRLCDQLADQANKVLDQMRRLPSYQINWPAVREVMRDLQEEFLKLRRVANKCLNTVTSEEQRRSIRELIARIDRKVEVCHSMGG